MNFHAARPKLPHVKPVEAGLADFQSKFALEMAGDHCDNQNIVNLNQQRLRSLRQEWWDTVSHDIS